MDFNIVITHKIRIDSLRGIYWYNEQSPDMVHFVVEEERERIVIPGVICTHRDPKIWKERTK